MEDQRKASIPEWNGWVAGFLYYFPIYVQHDHSVWTSMHRQPGVEIHITHEGMAKLLTKDCIIMQEPCHLAIIDGNQPHQLVASSIGRYTRTVICLDLPNIISALPAAEDSLAKLLKLYINWANSRTNVLFGDEDFVWIEQLCFRMLDEAQAHKTGWRQMMIAYLTELTVLLQRSLEQPSNTAPKNMRNSAKLSTITQAGMEHINENFKEDISLKSVASQLHVSPEHLTRTFRRELQVTFYQYLINKRIEEAKRLLSLTETTSVTEVGFMVGFNSLSSFSRAFQQTLGESPKKFRQRILSKRMSSELD